MISLAEWALKWGVPFVALEDLRQQLGIVADHEPSPMAGRSEAAVQNSARLAASDLGGRLWRNNVGAYKDQGGAWHRFGLCNDSEKVNKVLKSSDLIGLYPLLIGPEHVGRVVGQFWAVEVKEGDWPGVTTEHEEAQLAYGQLVISLGGRFEFNNTGVLK